MEAWSVHFVLLVLSFFLPLYELIVLLFLWGFFCSTLLFSLMLSLLCCLSSVFLQAKNKMRAWVHLVLLWNAIWSPECQPVLGCHLRHFVAEVWALGPHQRHTFILLHPSIIVWDEKSALKGLFHWPPHASYIKPSDDVILDVWSTLLFLWRSSPQGQMMWKQGVHDMATSGRQADDFRTCSSRWLHCLHVGLWFQ